MKVIHPGLFTTIQDKGRVGFSKFGISQSGAMDQKSFKLANALLGNEENCAVIEWVLQPPKLQFTEPAIICLTGANIDACINEKSVRLNHQIQVCKGDILSFNICKNKVYGYVGIKNGFLSEVVFKSRSFFKGITKRECFHKDDLILYKSYTNFEDHFSSISKTVLNTNYDVLHVFLGPEFERLSLSQKELLLGSEFTVSNIRSRMAIQLEENLNNDLPSMLTSPVLPGTIQLTPSGKLMVLMRDCQVTGGYPRVLQLRLEDIDILAQMRTGAKLRFHFLQFT
ncbi:biotin-dependent carboxyltransferase family protein [Aquimarina sp. MMG016]|uniref:5-oxoprolinase subunit C family protein n=1 Tax=Aquimarina sp. MMG016 TaxID=2822690 RepID=UPI001B3A1798|nr:biotin-dependent carboxyltransferase family protein [Aquimarina sp. MMG016]